MIFGRHYGDGWLQTGFFIYAFVFALFYVIKLRTLSREAKIQSLLLGLSIALIVDLTLFPMAVNQEAIVHVIEKHSFSYNLVPMIKGFRALQNGTMSIIAEMVLNVLLFVPLGYMLRRDQKQGRTLLKVVLLGFLMSLTIELVQLVSLYQGLNVRIFDIDDLILNTLGSLIGALIYRKK